MLTTIVIIALIIHSTILTVKFGKLDKVVAKNNKVFAEANNVLVEAHNLLNDRVVKLEGEDVTEI